jgi:signal transduction histidine kinase/ligand-binding sensor domain-containing protein
MQVFSSDDFTRKDDYYTQFKTFLAKDGLSSDLVLAILQDKFGVMWFATNNGLTRYDGVVFTVYRHKKELETSLSDNFVTSLTEDSYGNLWIGTQNGLNRYNRKTNNFTRFDDKNGLKNNCIKAIYADKNGVLWVESNGGYLSRFDIKNNLWTHKNRSSRTNEGEYFYHQIFEDSKHNLWIGGRNEVPTKIPNKNINNVLELSFSSNVKFSEASCYVETLNGELFWINYPNSSLSKYNSATNRDELIDVTFGAIAAICDKNGKIWLGGSSGIMQVDFERKEITRIKHNAVYCLYKDKSGRIWVGTDKGVSFYSEDLNIFRHYKQINGLDNGLISNEITALMQDKEGLIWVGTAANGVDTFSLKTEKFGNLTYNLLRHNLDKKTFEREKNVLKQYYLHKFISADFDNYDDFRQKPLHFQSANENKVSALYQDKEGKIYIGLWSHIGFNIYDKRQKTFKRQALWSKAADNSYPRIFEGNPFGANWYAAFLEDSQSRFWCATWEAFGLNLFDRKKGEFSPKHYIPSNQPRNITPYQLAFDSVRQRMYLGGGFYYGYFDFKTQKFVRYAGKLPQNYTNKKIFEEYFKFCDAKFVDIPHNFICINYLMQNNSVFIQTENSVIKHNLITDKFSPSFLRKQESPYFQGIAGQARNDENAGMPQNYTDSKDKTWFLTRDGLKMLDTNGDTVIYKHNSADKFSILGNVIYSVCEDGNSNLWVSTTSGLCLWERETNRFIDLSMPDERTLTSRLTSCLMQDFSGNIWVGTTENGISVLDPKTDKFKHYIYRDWNKNGISDNYINCIYQCENGTIWVGTNRGLNKFNPQNDNFEHIEPLAEYKIMGIQEDFSGNLWVSTNDGLFCLNSSGKIIRAITDFFGLQDKSFSKAACRLANGDLAFGGNYGFNIFKPELLTADFEPCPLVFSQFCVKDSVRYFDLNENDKIDLKYHENSFSIRFSSTDYEHENQVQFRYKLEGFDQQWTYTKMPALTAKYTNIPYGNFTFVAEVSNCFGEWKNVQKTLSIHIATPWYRQIWCIVLVFLLLILTIISIIRIREKRLKQANIRLENIVEKRTDELKKANQKLTASEEELRAMNDAKNKFFSIISHDLRNPLKALNQITHSLNEQYEQLSESERQNLIQIIHETTGQTGMLLENLLLWALSQRERLTPNFQKTDLLISVNETIDFLELTAQKKQIKLINNIKSDTYICADANLLSTILRNLISNAIHFSFPNSEITVSAKENGGTTEISVTDSGVGISEENAKRLFRLDSKIQTKGTNNEKGSGLGLLIVKEFVNLQGGKIWVESAVGKGSTFTFSMKN